ncbi:MULTISPECIES: hypothetical protein [Cohaesibacter]|uniref:hypothetical protein n=1 Tax=Cohaesibacter TaxID=655352 RepID=UPI001300BBD2|nr:MULTISPECIES: hypothetical protein [Cohaesibacter]
MVSNTMLAYFAALFGVLAMIAPLLSTPVSRFVFGSVLGIVVTTTWPVAKILFG